MSRARRAIRRVLISGMRDQLERAITALREDREAAVHEARRSIKKARAIAQLLRHAGARRLKADMKRLRHAHHLLSSARDAEVAVATFERVRVEAGLPQRRADMTSAYLAALCGRRRRALDRGDRKRVIRILAAVERRVDDWRVPRLSRTDVSRALAAAYAASREALATADASLRIDDLHRWRRRLKSLNHQMQALVPTAPGLRWATRPLGPVDALLGTSHDYDVLVEVVLRSGLKGATVRAVEWAAQTAAVTPALEAFERGRRLHRESPAAFKRRMAGLLARESTAVVPSR